ncbi:hypothetical protein EDD21DRAFT_369648 [Dissophora ornata]|nr:hypothetical protein EDD21DRAFT_369648 [Dissophora ornata]
MCEDELVWCLSVAVSHGSIMVHYYRSCGITALTVLNKPFLEPAVGSIIYFLVDFTALDRKRKRRRLVRPGTLLA